MLAMLMFSTSMGFSIDMHYCQGELKSFSILGKAKGCHEGLTKVVDCPIHGKMVVPEDTLQGCNMDQKDCCQNKTIYIQSEQDLVLQKSQFTSSKHFQQFLVAHVEVFIKEYIDIESTLVLVNYRPPLISRDIPVLTQSFLL